MLLEQEGCTEQIFAPDADEPVHVQYVRFRCETGGKVSTARYNGCYQLICEYFRREQEVSHVTSAAAANTLVCRGVTFIRQGN